MKTRLLIETVQQLCAGCLHVGAVAGGTGDDGVGAVRVVSAVCCCGPLGIQIQLIQDSGGHI